MQSFNWYVNRLRTMSPREVAWRVADAARDGIDRARFGLRLYPQASDLTAPQPQSAAPPALCTIPVGVWRDVADDTERRWSGALTAKADQLMQHRFTFFNLKAHDLGTPIDWNRDHESGHPAPLSFAPAIDYRDLSVTGDAKIVWEPSRHHQLVVLGRAYRATGDVAYAHEVIAQIESWLDQSPFGYGMNWRSPLELAIRAINWVWALALIEGSGAEAGEAGRRIRHAMYLHVWEISRKFSRGSSANNHLIGEAAGVLVATAYFRDLPNAAELLRESRAILEREIDRQNYSDGGNREQAIGYHLFVLQFFLVAGITSKRLADDMAPGYWKGLERMLEFVAALAEGGRLPMIGDADDGYVLDLGSAPDDPRGLLAVGAELYGRRDFATAAGGRQEWVFWLLGSRHRPPAADLTALQSRALPASGYYLLQAGSRDTQDAVSLVIDCGELGLGALAAHGHADALSLVLRVNGHDVLVDPGTYDYFTYPDWRRYYRGTPAHNTLTIDDTGQSEITGPFMWGARANAKCTEWAISDRGGVFEGEHDGYKRLSDPVVHRRRVELDSQARAIIVEDTVVATGAHALTWYLHLGEDCTVEGGPEGRFRILWSTGAVTIVPDGQLELSVVPRSDAPSGGWVSRGYHRKTPATLLVARAQSTGLASFRMRLLY
jgi:hypothetical protein